MAEKNIGYIDQINGTAEVKSVDGINRVLSAGDKVQDGDLLTTGLNTSVTLEFYNGETLLIGASTDVLLDETIFADLESLTDDRVNQLAELQQLLIEGVDLSEQEAPAAGNESENLTSLGAGSVFARNGTEGQVDTQQTPVDFNGGNITSLDILGDDDLGPLQENIDTTGTTPGGSNANATITLNPITSDNVINAAEASGVINVTGSVGGDATQGSSISLVVNGMTYTGIVAAGNVFSIPVSGADLAASTGFDVTVTGTGTLGIPFTATASASYTIDTSASASILVDNITADDIVDNVEGTSTINITGSVGGDASQGDQVSFTINNTVYTGLVASDNTFGIAVAGADLLAQTSFDVTVTGTDAAGNPFTATATSTHTANNNSVVVDDQITLSEDSSIDIDVIANDTDVDGGPASPVDTITQGSHGTVTINPDGTIKYTPDPDYNGPDSFTYTNQEGTTGTVTVTVDAVADNSVVVDDQVTLSEDSSIDIDVIANDTDVDGGPASPVDTITQGSHGTVTINPDGTIKYTPDPDYNGPDSFTYTNQEGTTGTVTVTVDAVADNSVVVDDQVTLSEDSSIDIDVIANDTDVDGGPASPVDTITQGSHGTVTINPDGTIKYTPDPDYNGPDSFTYTNQEGTTGTVTVTVDAVADNSVVVDDQVTLSEDSSIDIDVIANDTDVDGGPASPVDTITQGSHCTVTINPDGTIKYTPDPDYNGPDSFTYTNQEGTTGTVTVTVDAVADNSVVVDDQVTLSEDSSIDIDVIANDTDVDGGPASPVDTITQGSHGTVTINPDGTIKYTPDPDYNGPDSFTYTNQEGTTGTVTVTVDAVADNSVVVDDQITLSEDSSIDIDVIANDTDVDGGPASPVDTITQGSHGTVTINPDGTIKYTPDPDYNGPDSFTYTNQEGTTGTVAVTVDAVADNSVVVDDQVTLSEDSSIDIDVIANDTDVDGGPASPVDTITQGSHGTVTINPDGTIKYTPDPDYNGPDSFTYTNQEGTTGTVTVAVEGIADAPVLTVVTPPIDLSLPPQTGSTTEELDQASIEAQLGLPAGILDTFNPPGGDQGNVNVVDGAITAYTYDLSSGDRLELDWTFTSSEDIQSEINSGFNDLLVYVVTAPDGTSQVFQISSSEEQGPNGTDSGTQTLNAALDGTYEIYFVVLNGRDDMKDSSFTVETTRVIDTDNNQVAIALGIASHLSGLGGSEILTIQIDGVPATASLSAGTLIDGVWHLTQSELTGLTLTSVTPLTSTVDLTVSATATENGTSSTVTENISIIVDQAVNNIPGTPASDTITGTDANDNIQGFNGSDTLQGGLGNDLLFGGQGSDSLHGEDGNDLLFGGDGSDSLSGGEGDDALNAGDGDDQLSGGAGSDTLNGDAGADTLIGGTGNDALNGGDGMDILTGGLDDDILTGGSGPDSFVWNSGDEVTTDSSPANDTINDFEVGAGGDQLNLADLLQGEETGDLTDYLHFAQDENGGTVISIDANAGTSFESVQNITLNNVDLTAGGTLTDQQILDNLLSTNNLIVDT